MKCGYELELLAPAGETRYTIATYLAKHYSCQVTPFFHRESDLWPKSLHSKPFYCLTRGFRLEKDGSWQFKVVNDMTIGKQIDLEKSIEEDWYHLLSDDIRLIDLMHSHCDPNAKTPVILLPIAKLFRTTIQKNNDIFQVIGPRSSLICASHRFFGDRNRICELVTAPIHNNHKETLQKVLALMIQKGCTIPEEAAFHIHFDAIDFYTPPLLLRLIRYFHVWSNILKALIPPNPNCTRIGAYAATVIDYAFDKKNQSLSWSQTTDSLKKLGAQKYCDFNFVNVLNVAKDNPQKRTIEIRTIPMTFDADALVAATGLFSGFLDFIKSTDHDYANEALPVTAENIHLLLDQIAI